MSNNNTPPILEEATRLNEAGKYVEALSLYDQILTQNHDNPSVLGTIATVYLRSNAHVGTALSLFHYAIECYKKRGMKIPSEILTNLSVAYKHSGQYDKCKLWLEKSIELDPNVGNLTNYGSMFVEQNDHERGEEALRRAIKIAPDNPLPKWNLALLLLESGRWKEGWEMYEYGESETGMRRTRNFPRPKWNGQAGTVCVSGEQGIGDEIMFASMLPEIMKTNKVILECHPRLKTLFEKSFPGLECHPTRKDAEVSWMKEPPQFDYRLMIGSLGKFYRPSLESFPGTPYLKADPLPDMPKGRKLRVGISWTGGKLSQRVAKRTVPLNWWRSILNNVDCEFVSLQYTDDSPAEIESVNKLGYSIKQRPEIIEKQRREDGKPAEGYDYYETARVVASCDLVITVNTSIVHLAGALGVPAWCMTPKFPAWRYQRSGKMPWYRSVRLYRQAEEGAEAYIPIIQRIGLDLEDFAKSRMRKVA